MPSRRKKVNRAILTEEEKKTAAARLMLAAIAHQYASAHCLKRPATTPPAAKDFLFPIVSFELILLSVEQSLRLLLLLHYSMVLDNTSHSPYVLYRTLRKKSGGKGGIRQDIIREMNVHGQPLGIDTISEKDLDACLRKHDSSYSDTRYFWLDPQAKTKNGGEILSRESHIFHLLAVVLIALNDGEMKRQGSNIRTSIEPGSEMTEKETAIITENLRLIF